MTNAEILAKIQTLFHDVFDDETLVIKNETNAEDIEDWDSLTHINLVVAIQKEFGISFLLGELEDLKNVRDMIDLIREKLA